MIIYARTHLILNKTIIKLGDCIVDYYYLRSADVIEKEKDIIKATFDLLVISQECKSCLISVVI